MQDTITISTVHIELEAVLTALSTDARLELSQDARDAIRSCRDFLDGQLAREDCMVYGVNTGFGSQYHVKISAEETEALQRNLILSHAAGVGDPIDPEVARTILLLKIISLCKGHSGVTEELVLRLADYYNRNLTPVIYEMGSLGASGDLAPLAHMSLTLLGEGAFYGPEDAIKAAPVLDKLGIEPISLKSKEGLALINGTQFSAAHGLIAWRDALKLLRLANLTASYAIEAYDCNMTPFDDRIQQVRGHVGQIQVAADIRQALDGSSGAYEGDKQLQDPSAFRCIPQVHGATYDVLAHAGSVLETEINAATDNPLVFPESEAILSGGNFHAQPIAMLLDYMAISIAELGSISERRTYKLLSGERNLPACLIENPGLRSGLMIAQYTAASVVNRNKILCTPASVDSIPSSMGQEDHVSMAANAGTKLREVTRNTAFILAIEFLSATQAVELKGIQGQLSPLMQNIFEAYRQFVPLIEEDVIVHDYIQDTLDFFDRLDFSE